MVYHGKDLIFSYRLAVLIPPGLYFAYRLIYPVMHKRAIRVLGKRRRLHKNLTSSNSPERWFELFVDLSTGSPGLFNQPCSTVQKR